MGEKMLTGDEIAKLFVKINGEVKVYQYKQRLERIATAAMQGELASQDAEQGWPMESHDKLAAVCVSAARALIAELDKEEE